MASGIIGEHGTYAELMARAGEFSRLAREFGGEQEREEEVKAVDGGVDPKDNKTLLSDDPVSKEKMRARVDLSKVAGKGTLEGRLMVKEKRTTGAVPWHSESQKLTDFGMHPTNGSNLSLWSVYQCGKGVSDDAADSIIHVLDAR